MEGKKSGKRNWTKKSSVRKLRENIEWECEVRREKKKVETK